MQHAGGPGPRAGRPLGAQRALVLGAARQRLAGGVVAGVEPVVLRLQHQRAGALRGRQRDALQRGTLHIGRAAEVVGRVGRAATAVGLVADEVAHPVAVDGGRSLAGTGLPRHTGLDAAPALGLKRGHAVAGVVEVVEAGRAEGGAGQGTQLPAWRPAPATAQAAGGDAAEVGTVVPPQVALPRPRSSAAGQFQHPRGVAAAHVGGVGGGLGPVVVVLDGRHELAQYARLPGQLRGDLLAFGAEAFPHAAAVQRIVDAARSARRGHEARCQRAAPVQGGDLGVQLATEVRRRILRIVRRQEFAAVVLRVQPRAQQHEAQAVAGGGRQAQAQLRGVEPVAVVVGVVVAEGVAGAQRRDAVAALAGQRAGQVQRAGAAAETDRPLAAAVAADGRATREAVVAAAARRDDLHHAAHGVGAVQAGTRPAQHLDALGRGQAQGLQRREAQRRRTHAHAVHQDHRLLRRGAADEQPRALPGAAAARDLHAGLAAQQVGQRVGGGGAQGLGADHHHVGGQPLGRQGFARTGDDDFRRRLRNGHADEGKKTNESRAASAAAKGRDHLGPPAAHPVRPSVASPVSQEAFAPRPRCSLARPAATQALPAAIPASHAPGRYPGSRVPAWGVTPAGGLPRLPRPLETIPGPSGVSCGTLLADRCGGSTGIAAIVGRSPLTGFPFNPPPGTQAAGTWCKRARC